MQRQPKLAEAVITALTSDDAAAGKASISTTGVMTRVIMQALPDDLDAETEAAIARVLGHVWFSCLVAWKTAVADPPWYGPALVRRTSVRDMGGQVGEHMVCGGPVKKKTTAKT